MKLPLSRWLLFGLLGGALGAARAEVALAPLFQDHAVLQRDMAVPVWGRADKGEKISVEFRGQKVAVTAGKDGRWSVRLAPMPASAEPAELVVTGKNTVRVADVLVGEVWLCSGQSNMAYTVRGPPGSGVDNAETEVAAADHAMIRHFKVERTPADAPADTVKGAWAVCSPETAGQFTAVGYFFARDLHQKLGVPIGLINSAWGGTPIESWLPEAELRQTSAWPAFNARWQEALKVFPERQAAYPALSAAWLQADADARASGKKTPLPRPPPPIGPGTAYAPGSLYNGMIAPLIPGALRGVLWYQGEANVGRAQEYGELLTALIRGWRGRWSQGDFPFYFVQLPNFADGNPAGRNWAALREAQTKALALPRTAMAVTIDIGDPDNIHPRNKQEVGRRLALIAGQQLYGLAGSWTGPVFKAAVPEGAALRVLFDHAGDGLIAFDQPITAFEIAGADRKFVTATARIEHDTVVVSAAGILAPVAVRYAWTNAPVASLFNGAGLPVAPFRSDDW